MEQKKRKFKWALAVVSFGVVAGALLYTVFVPRPARVDVTKVTRGVFQETIRADGILRSKDRYTVTAFADGDIKRVALKIGDVVKKGESLTELYWNIKYDPVKAPISGVVAKVYRESAGPVRRGDPIVEIIDPQKLEVMSELLTTDAVRLRVGNPAWINNWSGGSPIEAKVTRVSKAGFTKLSALGVEEERTEVTAELLKSSSDILENVGSSFHVDVIFKVSETTDALKIPVGALFRDGMNWAVYLAEGGRARKQNIEVKSLGEKEASIASGLQVGQLVLVYPGDLVKDGSRIQMDDPK